MTDLSDPITQYIWTDLSNDEESVATLFHRMYSSQYYATKENEQVKWYKQTDKGWYSSSSVNHEIKLKMSTEVIQRVMTIRGAMIRQRTQTNDHDETRTTILRAIEKNLSTIPYRERLLRVCEPLFSLKELPQEELPQEELPQEE
jgi:hypothetical protein